MQAGPATSAEDQATENLYGRSPGLPLTPLALSRFLTIADLDQWIGRQLLYCRINGCEHA